MSLPGAPASYAEALSLLRELGHRGIDLGLERVRAIAGTLGHPEKTFASILVAGTNGKGSTCAMLAAILEKAGHRVGLYTSPHLVRETERVRVGGKDVSEEAFTRSARAVCDAVAHAPIPRLPGRAPVTAFEFLTLIAFDHFAREHVEIAVVEVGLGGRLDATNIVEPLVSVITPVGLDHQQYLGETLEQIALEKAGILRPGVPFVSASRNHEVKRVLAARAKDLGVPILRAGNDFDFLPLRDRHMHYAGPQKAWRDLRVGLSGMHQLSNAAAACAVCELLEKTPFPVSEQAVRGGLEAVNWRGRLETVSTQPLVLVDGAHNADGARSLRRYLEQYVPFRKVHLVIGQRPDKDAEAFLSILAPVAARITLTETSDGALVKPEFLAHAGRKVHGNVIVEPDVEKILRQVYWRRPEEELIVVTGSLYLVGEVLGLLESGAIEGYEPAGARG